jgi:thiol-disulfide isomerase/thioredoxin
MTARRLPLALAALALVGILALGLAQLAGSSRTATEAPAPLTGAQVRARLAGSPPVLAALHAQGGALLGGGARALHARLTALRGRPVVVNKWASWCQPCRAELPILQRAAVDFGQRVAFVGIDSGEGSRADALTFLRTMPLSYPSYYDPSGQLGGAITESSFMPVTVFYDAHGNHVIQQGPYLQLAELERAIERYALDA